MGREVEGIGKGKGWEGKLKGMEKGKVRKEVFF